MTMPTPSQILTDRYQEGLAKIDRELERLQKLVTAMRTVTTPTSAEVTHIETIANAVATAAEPRYNGYTETQIREAFDRVCNPVDWKLPICATIPEADAPLYSAAIEFFTATKPTLRNWRKGQVTITSIGYYRGPAGDH